MKDIENREDIEFVVNSFYEKIIKDDLIGVFFTKIVQVKWDSHMPIMYDFWESVLLAKAKYKGNPMLKHIELNKMKALKVEHFDRWLKVWEENIRTNFSGDKTEEMISKAKQIASLMQFKVLS